MRTLIAWFFWNPPKDVFVIPYIDRPVAWYGVLFVLGFILGYFIITSLFYHFLRDIHKETHITSSSDKQTSYFLADRLCWFTIIGTIVGARLGAVFFYDWSYYQAHPIEIFKIWKGGLASHGGTIGVLLAVYLYSLYIKKTVPTLRFLTILDYISIPTALVACFIRLGNFVNQEILGAPTFLPWGVVFGKPFDDSAPIPRHPVQLYEAFSYLGIFFILFFLWKRSKEKLSPGTLSGLLLVLVYSSRFIIEYWKEPLDSVFNLFSLQAGQLLSIPFIALGFFLIVYGKKTQPVKFLN